MEEKRKAIAQIKGDQVAFERLTCLKEGSFVSGSWREDVIMRGKCRYGSGRGPRERQCSGGKYAEIAKLGSVVFRE